MSDETAVTAMLSAAGLTPPADELAELVAGYAQLRSGLDSLYAPAFAQSDPYLVPTVTSGLSLP